jgi:hypothetical protein
MMRKFPKRAWMSFCHGALRGAPSCANFLVLRKKEARSVGLACRMAKRRGASRAFSSAVDQNRPLSTDRAHAVTTRLPRCLPWDIAMIDKISPTAKASFLKRRARSLTHALRYTPRRRTKGLDDDRRVRAALHHARAANLTGMPRLTQIWAACLDVPSARMKTGTRVASSAGGTPVVHKPASELWSAKPMLDNWAIPIKLASVPELHWKSAPCRSSLDAPRSQ